MLRRKLQVKKSVELVLRLEESLWWERFVKDVGLDLEPGVNKWGTYGYGRKCGNTTYVVMIAV